jgi:hypothetical protein
MRAFVSLLLIASLIPATVVAQEKPFAVPSVATSFAPGGFSEPITESTLNAVATFDGEGEGEVAVELGVMNSGTDPLTDLTLTIPGTELRIVRALEETKELIEACYFGQTAPCPTQDTAVFRALAPQSEPTDGGTRLSLALPQGIPSAEGRRIYLVYKVQGYATQRASRFAVDFPTPTVALDLATVTVNVRVTAELTLKGGRSSTDFEPTSVSDDILSAPLDRAATERPLTTEFMELSASQLGFTKTTSSLDPNESFHVTANYAKGWFVLYWPTVGLGLLGLGLLGGILWLGERSVGAARRSRRSA